MDFLIIGCGLSGSVVARDLAERGKKVTIWERRDHIGGNMYDYKDAHGILVQRYGPHTFHTDKKVLYDYICRFSQWDNFELNCMTEIDGIVTPTPFNFQTIDDFYSNTEAESLKRRICDVYGEQKTASVLDVLKNDDPKIRAYGQFLFEKDYRLYTAKQWGISSNEIDESVLERVPLRFSYDKKYFNDEYQVMPRKSYTEFFRSLLNHPNITVQLGIDALKRLEIRGHSLFVDGQQCLCPVVYTGALDELFNCKVGELPYRSLHFRWVYEDIDSKQQSPVIAYPQVDGYTRIIEFKKLPVQRVLGTTYVLEYPKPYIKDGGQEPYYPVLTEESRRKYICYKKMADQIENLYYCGRLADFQYYNMDQALERALQLCKEIL